MNGSPSWRSARRLIHPVVLLVIAWACGQATGPGGLRPVAERMTDEAIMEDLELIRTWELRLDIAEVTAGRAPGRAYTAAKARAWLDFAREEYEDNDRGPIVDEALAEAQRLVGLLVGEDELHAESQTPLPSSSRRIRPTLWAAAERFKANPRFDLVAKDVATMEVELVRAGHGAAPGAQCLWELHAARADSLGRHIDSVLAETPVKPVPTVVPMPAVADRDGDGVPDAIDCCPNTPPGQRVDALGCPPPLIDAHEVVEGVNFATDRFLLRPDTRALLDSIARELLEAGPAPVRVSGHTDSIAPRPYNQRLSESRARAVARFLVERGVDAERISTRGFGEDRPRGDNGTVAGRALNRRVELAWEVMTQPDRSAACAVPSAPDSLREAMPRDAADVRRVRLDAVVFASASIALTPTERARLDRVARTLIQSGARDVLVAGHADAVGDPDSNFALSYARAWKVRAYLIERGVPETSIAVRAYGSEQPMARGGTGSARSTNRRVTIEVPAPRE